MATRTLERTGFQAVDILGNQVPKQSTFSPRVILRNSEQQSKALYSGDLNSELVRYLNGPKQFAS